MLEIARRFRLCGGGGGESSPRFLFFIESLVMTLKFAATSTVGLMTVLLSAAALAVDPGCAPLIKASTPDANVPYKVSMTMVIDGKKEASESIYIGGFLYMLRPGAKEWIKMPMPDLKAASEMAARSLSGCSAGGIELVGTTPTRVWTSKSLDPFTKKPMDHRVWVGVADNRVYRQKVDQVEQLLSYSNISVPSPIASERKRKAIAP